MYWNNWESLWSQNTACHRILKYCILRPSAELDSPFTFVLQNHCSTGATLFCLCARGSSVFTWAELSWSKQPHLVLLDRVSGPRLKKQASRLCALAMSLCTKPVETVVALLFFSWLFSPCPLSSPPCPPPTPPLYFSVIFSMWWRKGG